MKKFYVQYSEKLTISPMTCWVHKAVGGNHWFETNSFDPPLPTKVVGQGYPLFFVEFDGFVFQFSSIAELDVLMETFKQKMLPSSERVTPSLAGPGSHWLNKLPATVKKWRYRQRLVPYLAKARTEFQKVYRP